MSRPTRFPGKIIKNFWKYDAKRFHYSTVGKIHLKSIEASRKSLTCASKVSKYVPIVDKKMC